MEMGKVWNTLFPLACVLFHFEPEQPSPFPEQQSIVCFQNN